MKKHILKRIGSAVIALSIISGMHTAVLAQNAASDGGNTILADSNEVQTRKTRYDLAADAMYAMNLFRGTDEGFELDRAPTRLEALIMLIRMTGNERNIYVTEYNNPFTDTPDWEEADLYLDYAYETGITKGVTETEFCPDAPATAQMYLTFMLRALGYADTEGETVWDEWDKLAKDAGILTDDINTTAFTRGDAVLASYICLDAKVQNTDNTLAEKLLENGTISEFSLGAARAAFGRKALLTDSLADILGTLYAAVGDKIMISRLQVTQLNEENLSFFLGVDSLDFEEGIACEPMMTSMAHSVCLVRLKDGVDVEKVKADIKAKVNPNKWICVGVEPENVRVENIENLVLLVMDDNAADGITECFDSLRSANGLTFAGGMYIDDVTPNDEKSIERFADKLKSVRDTYLKESNRVFYATIPHKSNFVKTELDSFLDHDTMLASLKEKLAGWDNIEFSDLLTLDDYYSTDTHWRQESLIPVMEKLAKEMDFEFDAKAYTQNNIDNFVGMYRSNESAISPEKLTWLTSDAINGAVVSDFQHENAKTVYNTAALETKSQFDLFLNGATPLEVIENNNAKQQRELVIFRDSFGSSIAPLFVDAYSKITLVDLRYMASSYLPEYVDFGNADVLFLYCDQLVNNSILLK